MNFIDYNSLIDFQLLELKKWMQNYDKIHLSFDMDCFDANDFNSVNTPVPNGPKKQDIMSLIGAIKNNFTYYLEKLNTPDQVAYDKYQDWVEPVPETVLWLVKDNHYIGTLSIRHRLNWHLEKWGGHVHYKVRPSLRNKGFGKKMLYNNYDNQKQDHTLIQIFK